MPKETVSIRLSSGWPLEAAASFLAALAYPDDLKTRDRFRVAFCHEAFVKKMEQDPDVGQVGIPAEYLSPIPWLYRQGLTRLHGRATAGQMLLGLIEPRWFGMTQRPSVNRVAELAAGVKNSANVKSRAWRQSRAVIHAAGAFAAVREKMGSLGLPDTLGHLIDEPVLIGGLVSWSEQIRIGVLPTLDTNWRAPGEAETIQFVLV